MGWFVIDWWFLLVGTFENWSTKGLFMLVTDEILLVICSHFTRIFLFLLELLSREFRAFLLLVIVGVFTRFGVWIRFWDFGSTFSLSLELFRTWFLLSHGSGNNFFLAVKESIECSLEKQSALSPEKPMTPRDFANSRKDSRYGPGTSTDPV